IGFLWGMYPTQWNAVHVWITTWVAAMFFVPIYWKSNICTTPELLEKRFNVQCRAFFSVVMLSVLIVTLAFGVYLGALVLKKLPGMVILDEYCTDHGGRRILCHQGRHENGSGH
ncbi:hypothetical protein ACFL47_10775, partial [Candidatus Latescibacterota bacterium]